MLKKAATILYQREPHEQLPGRLTVVYARGVLDGDLDAVVPRASPPKVATLEVERGLGESVFVRDVVYGVDDVEGVGTRGVEVGCGGGSGFGVLLEDELVGARLGGYTRGGAFVRDSIVTTASRRSAIELEYLEA